MRFPIFYTYTHTISTVLVQSSMKVECIFFLKVGQTLNSKLIDANDLNYSYLVSYALKIKCIHIRNSQQSNGASCSWCRLL